LIEGVAESRERGHGLSAASPGARRAAVTVEQLPALVVAVPLVFDGSFAAVQAWRDRQLPLSVIVERRFHWPRAAMPTNTGTRMRVPR